MLTTTGKSDLSLRREKSPNTGQITLCGEGISPMPMDIIEALAYVDARRTLSKDLREAIDAILDNREYWKGAAGYWKDRLKDCAVAARGPYEDTGEADRDYWKGVAEAWMIPKDEFDAAMSQQASILEDRAWELYMRLVDSTPYPDDCINDETGKTHRDMARCAFDRAENFAKVAAKNRDAS